MKIIQAVRKHTKDWNFTTPKIVLKEPLVLVFGAMYTMKDPDEIYGETRKMFPDGHIIFGSTSGDILGQKVFDNEVVLTAIELERTHFSVCSENASGYNGNIRELGKSLVSKLPSEGLRHVFVVSDGVQINGSMLIEGLETNLPEDVNISGGLCGDGAKFERTLVSYNATPKEGEVVAIGFYGDALEVSYASHHGWTEFGPERIITKSKDNVLYELDHKPALDLYKRYLGEMISDLPQSALLYPLSVQIEGSNKKIVRTILSIDEEEGAMILAGDLKENARVRLMMSTVDDIVAGAAKTAKLAMKKRKSKPELALLISCVGRKLVMDQRTEEEVEEVLEIIGPKAHAVGFYSHGEMAPFANQKECQLHNQTMTLTLLSE